MLTQARLKELLEYSPETGKFVWKISRGCRLKGAETGCLNNSGYLHIGVDGTNYLSSRLAFLWMTGSFPDQYVDHIDGVRINNRWSNLRNASRSQNTQNSAIRSDSKSKLKGVNYRGSGRWRARIQLKSGRIHLGDFNCPAAAHFAYVVATDTYFGEFARAA